MDREKLADSTREYCNVCKSDRVEPSPYVLRRVKWFEEKFAAGHVFTREHTIGNFDYESDINESAGAEIGFKFHPDGTLTYNVWSRPSEWGYPEIYCKCEPDWMKHFENQKGKFTAIIKDKNSEA